MAQSGDACIEAGVYETDCEHALTRRFQPGDVFPPCDRCGSVVCWLLTSRGATVEGKRATCPVRHEPGVDTGNRGEGGGDPCC